MVAKCNQVEISMRECASDSCTAIHRAISNQLAHCNCTAFGRFIFIFWRAHFFFWSGQFTWRLHNFAMQSINKWFRLLWRIWFGFFWASVWKRTAIKQSKNVESFGNDHDFGIDNTIFLGKAIECRQNELKTRSWVFPNLNGILCSLNIADTIDKLWKDICSRVIKISEALSLLYGFYLNGIDLKRSGGLFFT